MKPIRYSAPGKVIISGEHAVVYGKPALVCALNKRLTITFAPAKKTQYKDAIFPLLEKYVIDFLVSKKEKYNQISYSYFVESTIPIGRGLGSSAAYCACISAGLLELFTGKEWSKEDINICAYKMEKYFHKNSSGVDTSTSVMGGLIFYRKEFEFLKTISSLSVKIPKKFVDKLFLIDTGKPDETTGEMVQKVGKLFNINAKKTEVILNEIEKTTKRIIISIMKEDVQYFTDNLAQNELLLDKLGVVSRQTQKYIASLRHYGVGKVTGAGGKKKASGHILFFCNNEASLSANTFEPFVPSYKGLIKEK